MNNLSKTVLRDVGLLMHVPGVMALLSLPICWFFQEKYALSSFVLTALLSIGFGQLLYRLFRGAKAARRREALQIVALSWAVIPLLGAIPYLAIASQLAAVPDARSTIGEFQSVWNALFEAVSGFTSTGLTMARDSSQLPHCLQWWRSFTQWVGGVGLIVLTLSILNPSTSVQQLYEAETRQEKIAPTIKETVQQIWIIYLLYTVLSVLLLAVAGMPWWAAVNHGMTGIATGGFAITGNSFGDYGPLVQLAAIPVMVAGAISFSVHSRLLRQRQFSALWKDTRHQALWLLLALGTLALLLEHYWYSGSLAWIDSLFQWTSALSTCGFSTVKEQNWSATSQLLMSLAMVFGPISGSAAGGLKLDRVVILYKSVVWYLRLIFIESPEELRYELNGEFLPEKEAHRHLKSATVLALLWLCLLVVGVVILLHVVDQYTLTDIIFETTSALGISGLSTGITSPDLAWQGKFTLIYLMWAGRLEIIAVLILFASLLPVLRPPVRRR